MLAGLWLATAATGAKALEPMFSGGPYVPTPQRVVDAMLSLARVTDRDFVMDLGSGDGRIVITAAQKYGARGKGVDIDGELVERSNASARKLNLDKVVRFEQADVLRADVREATVVTLYLLPDMMRDLRGKLLRELKPGTRIVSHDFDFGDWKPERTVNLNLDQKYDITGSWTSMIHLWTVPPRAAR
jgi:ubiquinone/menaquinone biosynthesis C-methylase UbiE